MNKKIFRYSGVVFSSLILSIFTFLNPCSSLIDAMNEDGQKLETEHSCLEKKLDEKRWQIQKEETKYQSVTEINKAQKTIVLTMDTSPAAFMDSEIRRDGWFIAYANGTVLDTRTNLMWASKDNGSDINWNNAKNYCENYRGGGYTDWRMPTQDELAGLYDASKRSTNPPTEGCEGGYHITDLIHITCCCPWASETSGFDASYFFFSHGNRYWSVQYDDYNLRALPVRSGK
ncbi:MAG: hypothetical protein CSYNP_04238 [Syntrophus sp. SKADARSKE-3]|nr:hypothetical protein [Syntrophus sp. SKADARSKE-3]